MIIIITKAASRMVLLLLFFLSAITNAAAETPSKATAQPSDLQLQDVQSAADKINKKLDSFGPYMSNFDEAATDPGISSAKMLLYYDDSFFKNSSYKKLIVFYFGSDATRVDEYYPIKNKRYVVRLKLNTMIKPDRLNIESFLHEYEKMKKTVLSKYIFVDGRLVMRVGPNSETKTSIDDKLVDEGRVLLEREKVAVASVEMD